MTFLLRRVLALVPTLWVIVTITFFLIRLAPGGPFVAERDIPAEAKAALDAKYGLDQPLHVQYGRYLANVARFDFGPSYKYPSRTVREIVLGALPVSLELGGLALLLALVIGIPIGALAAVKQNTAWDWGPMGLAMLGVSLPNFVLGPLLVFGFALTLRWLPPAPGSLLSTLSRGQADQLVSTPTSNNETSYVLKVIDSFDQYDEDTTTLGVEAARLRGDRAQVPGQDHAGQAVELTAGIHQLEHRDAILPGEDAARFHPKATRTAGELEGIRLEGHGFPLQRRPGLAAGGPASGRPRDLLAGPLVQPLDGLRLTGEQPHPLVPVDAD